MKKTYRKVKQWAKDHEDGVSTAAVYALAVAASAGIVVLYAWAYKKAEEQQKELNDWTREQNFAGRAVYELADGSYIAVSEEQVS